MITRVTVSGFRGISGTTVFMPETLTILTGRNGLGKTTFFDAVDWCLFGDASKLGQQSDVIRNLYRPSTLPSVEVVLMAGNQSLTIARTQGTITLNGSPVTERQLAEALIVDPDVFPPNLRQLGKQVRTVTYLAQEQIREFVTAALSTERRALLRGLLGVPNAGLVESSIKRVRDHFSTRKRGLADEAETLSEELRELATSAQFDPKLEREAEEFVSAIQHKHGLSSSTVAELRASLEEQLATDTGTLTQLEILLLAHGEVVTVVAQVDKEVATLEEQRRTLENRLAEAEVGVRKAAGSIQAATLAYQELVKTATVREGLVSRLSSDLDRRKRLDELTSESARSDREHDEAAVRAKACEESSAAVDAKLAVAEKAVADHQELVRKIEARTAVESKLEGLTAQLRILQDQHRAEQARLSTLEVEIATLSDEITEAVEAKDMAATLHDRVAHVAERRSQVADLRDQLLALVDAHDSKCPLCGADYKTEEALRSHILESTTPSDADAQLSEASSALRASEAKVLELRGRESVQRSSIQECRTALAEHDRAIAQLEIQNGSLSASLRDIGDLGTASSSDDVLGRVRELQADRTKSAKLLEQQNDELRTINNRRVKLVAESEELRRNDRPPSEPPPTRETVAEARQALLEAQRTAQDQEAALRAARERHTTLEASLSDARSQLAGLEGRLSGQRDRRRRITDDFKHQCESAALPNVGLGLLLIGDDLKRRVAKLASEVSINRDAIGRALSIERRQVINENAARYSDRQKRLADSSESASVLRRAENRFEAIAEALESRSRKEADAAGAQHLIAIQECVNDLYPHRHLNEVLVDFANGELLVKDRWLKDGVPPHDYSSTGQANVLALSVFLGLALRQTFSLGRFILLDEPVQNLDDLHFLAFLTLVKRVALSRQVIISTADSNVAEIFRRQLRSWAVRDRRWCEYEWVAFHPQDGPTIKRHEGKQIAVA